MRSASHAVGCFCRVTVWVSHDRRPIRDQVAGGTGSRWRTRSNPGEITVNAPPISHRRKTSPITRHPAPRPVGAREAPPTRTRRPPDCCDHRVRAPRSLEGHRVSRPSRYGAAGQAARESDPEARCRTWPHPLRPDDRVSGTTPPAGHSASPRHHRSQALRRAAARRRWIREVRDGRDRPQAHSASLRAARGAALRRTPSIFPNERQ